VLSETVRTYLGKDSTGPLGLIEHHRIGPRRPQTNGKIERCDRNLLDEGATPLYLSNAERTRALDRLIHTNNRHRDARP